MFELNPKAVIEQGLGRFGLAVEECWDKENEWYVLKKGSALAFVQVRMIPIAETNDYRQMTEFRSPVFRVAEAMPAEFYKDLLDLNGHFSDGTAFFLGNGFLQLKLTINSAFLTPDLVVEALESLLYWSDRLDDELMEKFRDLLPQ